MTSPTPPSIGRIVHFTQGNRDAGGNESKYCRPAIVTEITGTAEAPTVSLAVFTPQDMAMPTEVVNEEIDNQIEPGPAGRTPGTWHWPEIVS
ncbi:hypothetical protein [Labedaea rhizosphaerae]|uniref:Uncharacterized protein n=1 Tax=Labedaea rhizosphaerae TaxID=598644 RepID=A0A4R6SDB3_LABRH|nr:hypothetical protein [Labedaea rhizosphaerae]TDP97637.1 hypothetical protein EV186_103601 [Labedaea rhizosphaerae]